MITLREIEPFNIPPVDNDEAASFMRRLTGNETFEWPGGQRPRAMMIYSLKYAYPRHSFGHGWLLPVSIDEFERICSTATGTMSEMLKQHVIVTIAIEYGGDLPGVSINAKTLRL